MKMPVNSYTTLNELVGKTITKAYAQDDQKAVIIETQDGVGILKHEGWHCITFIAKSMRNKYVRNCDSYDVDFGWGTRKIERLGTSNKKAHINIIWASDD